MKTWRVLRTDAATWQGTGQEYELRWQAEDAHRQHCTVVRDSDSDGYAATWAARNQVQEAAQ